MNLPKRLSNFTVSSNGCWLWNGKIEKGYGKVTYKTFWIPVHRAIFMEVNKITLSRSIHIHHKCAEKLCVNPEHLETISKAKHNTLHKGKIKEGLGKEIIEAYKTMPAMRVGWKFNLSCTTITSFLKSKGIEMRR